MMSVMAEPLGIEAAAAAAPVGRNVDFGGWVEAEQRRVALLCHHLLQDWDEAANASQDALLKAFLAWRKDGFAGVDDPGKWLTRVAVNTCLDRLRSRRWQFWRRRTKSEEEGTILEFVRDPRPDVEARVLAGQIERKLARALDRLSVRQRAVFSLRHFEDRSLKEIGEILGLDAGTVKAHLSRALTKLREELREVYAARGASR
jgi:RNA polymerase sigma-70 factor (ECF subfamily)